MPTCNRLDLQTLGSQPTMPKNLPNHCLGIPLELTISTRFPLQLPHTASNLWVNVRCKAIYWEKVESETFKFLGLQTEVSKQSDAIQNLKFSEIISMVG
jgi:hypothetical protein